MKLRIQSVFILIVLFGVVLIAQTPDWQWAKKFGETSYDYGYGITVDNAGNSYITGMYSDKSMSPGRTGNVFIAKVDASGELVGKIKAGGAGYDYGYGITIDNDGYNYIIGRFSGTASFGTTSLTSNGEGDIFVAKALMYSSSGSIFWATKAGGIAEDMARGIKLDNNGNIYVTGSFEGTATFGSDSVTSNGGKDIFVAKMDANGNWLWVTKASGIGEDEGYGITTDNVGNSYITGQFETSAMFGSDSVTSNGKDIFVAKINTNGDWNWVIKAGGYSEDKGTGIELDDSGNCYVTGYFKSTETIFGSDTLNSNSAWSDIFVAKINDNGIWQWATKAGGNDPDKGYGIALGSNGDIFITGEFGSTAFFGSGSLVSNGYGNVFVAKINNSGVWQWEKGVISTSIYAKHKGNGIAVKNTDNCFITGQFESSVSFASDSLTSSGYYDMFVAKLGLPVSVEKEILPSEFALNQNYPNPFNPVTTIEYNLPNNEFVSLLIYNINGQLVKTLISQKQEIGNHKIQFDGSNFASGIYIYKLQTGNFVDVKKLVLMK